MLNVEIRKRLPGFSLDVSLSAGSELVAIFGPSGSGKSLTLQCIAGLLKPDEGRIAINGRPVFDSAQGINLRPQERKVGYLFQDYALFPHLSVVDNIGYGLHTLSRGERAERVDKLLISMRLEGLERRRPGELSGGQQQRVALARVLATEPEMLLLDEPFSALDSPIRGRLHADLLELLNRAPITAILVTHDLNEAYTLSQKMVVYDAGRVLQAGPRDAVLRRPATRTVARFTATKNIFRGIVTSRQSGHLGVRVAGLEIQTPTGPYEEGETIDLCIRPEEIMLIRPDREAGAAVEENWYHGEVVGEIAHGTSFTLQFKLDGNPLKSSRDFDLHIDLPANVYYRLEIGTNKHWTVSLKKESIYLIGPAGP